MHHYFIIYKPYLVLTQFTAMDSKKCLADFFDVPKNVYPVGRLDYDSEGLLLLTNDTQINARLLQPKNKHHREYWVQVEGAITSDATNQLAKGLTINIEGKPFRTTPCTVNKFDLEPPVAERNPPIRFRKNIPTSWISIILTEGKNRQVRKMTAAAGFPTLRLIRYRIEDINIDGMKPGDMRQLNQKDVYQGLRL